MLGNVHLYQHHAIPMSPTRSRPPSYYEQIYEAQAASPPSPANAVLPHQPHQQQVVQPSFAPGAFAPNMHLYQGGVDMDARSSSSRGDEGFYSGDSDAESRIRSR
ncbi:hypothetical protein HK101_000249 [Irineochytrium annulatum]|nr:hypothetical protein HK101_000249 [Irineochytrium annulatum]